MKLHILFLTALTLITNFTYAAEERASAQEAETMVGKAVVHIQKVGAEQAYADFTKQDSEWKDRDLYVVVYGLDGRVQAHGLNPKMVGKDLINLKDVEGKLFVQERVQLAKTQSKFWQEYKFTDPLTKKILPKYMYCERLDETAVCSGVYNKR